MLVLVKQQAGIHRSGLNKKGVKMLSSCEYLKIDDSGLHISVDGKEALLEVDNIILCAGQEPLNELTNGLTKPYHLIGGAYEAAELDAKRAIDQGVRLAAVI